MTTLTASVSPRTWGISEPWVEIDVPVTFRRRSGGYGYSIVRSDTGQGLGWVIPDGRNWTAYVDNGAYYAATADLLTRTDKHPEHRAESWCHGEVAGRGFNTRAAAAEEVLWTLTRRQAESLEDLVAAARAPFLAQSGSVSPAVPARTSPELAARLAALTSPSTRFTVPLVVQP